MVNVGGAKRGCGPLADSCKIPCWYAVSGLNYKNGVVSVCARQSDQLSRYGKFDPDGKMVPSELYNTEGFKNLRKDLYNGIWNQGCKLCKEAEDFGNRSMRTDYEYDETFFNPETGEIDPKGLQAIELRFSNACNMACLHCSDVFSSKWTQLLKDYEPDHETKQWDLKQLTGREHRHVQDDGAYDNFQIRLTNPDVDRIVEDLNKNFPNIWIVDFAGGEVLIQKQFFHALKRLAEHPNKDNFKLRFHSNFNADFDPKELAEHLKPFGKTQITCSIDAGKNIYSYFRWGNWEQMESNIRKFREYDTKTELHATITTSAFQMLDIEDVFTSLMELPFEIIDYSIVQTPYYMAPNIVMDEHGDDILQQLDNVREKVKNSNYWNAEKVRREIINRAVDEIEQFCVNVISHPDWYKAFKVYIRKVDRLQNKRFNEHYTRYKFDGSEIYLRQT